MATSPLLVRFSIISFSILLGACMGTKPLQKGNQLIMKDQDCYPAYRVLHNDSLLETSSDFFDEPDSLTVQRFSTSSIKLASSLGILDLLNKYSDYEFRDSNSFEFLQVRQTLDERLMLAYLDISTTVAEIDCDENRTREASMLLLNAINKKVQKLNIISLIAGAVGTFASSTVAIAKPEDGVLVESFAIAGAAVTTYYSLKQLALSKKILFEHERNYLKDLKNGPVQSTIFHPNLWFYLNNDEISIRQELLDEFKKSGLLEVCEKDKKKESILFGEGGLYTVGMLEARIEMLGLLKSEINKMQYDLKLLQQEIVIGK